MSFWTLRRYNIFHSDGPRTLFNGDYRGEKGSSILDQRRRLVLTSVYSPRISNSDSKVARYLANNWQLSQITTLASAQPATAMLIASSYPFSDAARPGEPAAGVLRRHFRSAR